MESVDAVVSFLQTMNITHKHVACDASDVVTTFIFKRLSRLLANCRSIQVSRCRLRYVCRMPLKPAVLGWIEERKVLRYLHSLFKFE